MISLPILLASLGCVMAFELTPVHEWTRIEYRWSSESEKKLAIETGQYNYTNVFLYDAEWYKGKLFVTTPRTYDVNPASLSTVSEKFDAKGAALLQPYPSPEWHIVGNCSGITNALRFVIDKCGNMWIVDSGRIGNKVICPAQILKFDLETDQLIMRYEIPEKVSKGGLLSTSAVRTEGAECEEIMVFAADVRGRGYVIFDGSTSWRLDSDNFAPDVDSGNITVANRTVDIPDGPVAFMTLDKKFADIELGLMWSWTGRHAYGLSIQDLIKSRDSQENLKWYRNEYELSTSAPAGIVSREGIIFGAFIGPQKLKCAWLGNIVILENVEELIGESEIQLDIINLKITTDDDENEYLWFTANNYLQLRAGDTNFRKVNARIYVVNVADIINGTRCQPKAHVVPAKSWAEKGYIPLKEHDDVNTYKTQLDMIALPILLANFVCAMAFELRPVHQWSRIEYRWSSESEKKHAIATGLYDYTNVVLYDAEWHEGKLFVTTPRTHDANPATLSTVSEEFDAKGAALLQPYPSPEWHIVGNCSGITDALKFAIDECGNMWIVDTGTIGNEVICPAQILKFDLKTDQLVLRYKIPEEVSKGGLLSTSAVRTEGAECEEIMVFAADLRGSGYVIFDGSTSWRLENDKFEPDANFTKFTVDDQTVNITFGPIGLSFLDKKFADTELGLMWSFSANHAYGLSIQDLINSRDSEENLHWYKTGYEFPNSATAGIISKDGIIFGAFIGSQKLNCAWLGNAVTSENVEVLIQESEIPLEITNLKTTTDDDGNEYLWLTANDYLRMRGGITNFREVNFGIYVANIADLTNGTRCQPKAHLVPAESWAERGFIPLENHDDANI